MTDLYAHVLNVTATGCQQK